MKQKLFTRHGGRFIKSDDCGSTVAWIVEVLGRGPKPDGDEYDRKAWVRLSAQASLSDCSRRITWDLDYKEEESLAKVDAAIAELSLLRDALKEAFKVMERQRAEWKVKEEDE